MVKKHNLKHNKNSGETASDKKANQKRLNRREALNQGFSALIGTGLVMSSVDVSEAQQREMSLGKVKLVETVVDHEVPDEVTLIGSCEDIYRCRSSLK